MDVLSDTFKALSDQARLQIVALLLENDELCVCDLVGALGQTQSKISRHLRHLRTTGLLKDRRHGVWMQCRISPRLSAEQSAIIQTLAAVFDEQTKQALRNRLALWLEQGSKRGMER